MSEKNIQHLLLPDKEELRVMCSHICIFWDLYLISYMLEFISFIPYQLVQTCNEHLGKQIDFSMVYLK